MTSMRIKEVALSQFARNGYEGASLADIASKVGIKKQSIYTHFKGKDELFLEVLRDVAAMELQFVTDYFDAHLNVPVEDLLYRFLLQYQDRYEQQDFTRFFLRNLFFPPVHLENEIAQSGNHYVESIEELLLPVFDKARADKRVDPSISSQRATAAYTALLDGMFVEMLFGGHARVMKRMDASWFIYWRGIKMEEC